MNHADWHRITDEILLTKLICLTQYFIIIIVNTES
jgi:hypothetical protein